MKITFLGAAEVVTGSKFLIEHESSKVLIDCGLFQGPKEIRKRNWDDFTIDPQIIDAIILTHAHLDHIGYIPRLVKQGFSGAIYCSRATYDLAVILLKDSGKIQQEDAKRANKYGYTTHKPALPLYTMQDVDKSLALFRPVAYDAEVSIGSLQCKLIQSGHILGGSFVVVFDGSKTILFSGDLGHPDQPLIKEPTLVKSTDYLVLESTYGNKSREQTDSAQELAEVVNQAAAQKGKLIIPAFAVGRTQMILYTLQQLKQQGAIPDLPIFVDSPMATSVSDLYCRFNDEHKLSPDQCHKVFDSVSYVRTRTESKKLNMLQGAAIIISSSGMATGGRVMHHLAQNISNPKNIILFVGYQAAGTKGRLLVDGIESIRIHGKEYPVTASIQNIHTFSAHADYTNMKEWLSHFEQVPKKIFLVHGDLEALQSLKDAIKKDFGWSVFVPKYQESFELE